MPTQITNTRQTEPLDSFYLPQELVDTIIDFLGDDRLYLRQCSLVAKSWTRPCQQHLFKHISLVFQRKRLLHSRNRMASLLQMLSQRPYLQTYIQELTLAPYHDRPELTEKVSSTEFYGTLAAVLDKLTSLKIMHLEIGPWNSDYYPTKLKLVIVASVALPSLRCLFIKATTINVGDLRWILTDGLGKIKELYLGPGIAFSPAPSAFPMEQFASLTPHVFFDSLTISTYPTYMFINSWINDSHFSSPTLIKLNLDFPLTITSREQFLLDLASKSLEELRICIPRLTTSSISGHLQPSSLVLNLSYLQEIHIAKLSWGGPTKELIWVSSLFSSGTLPRLRIINLDIRYHSSKIFSDFRNPDRFGPLDLSSLDWDQWNALDEVLSQPGYQNIEEMRIFLHFHANNHNIHKAYLLEMEDILPQHLRWNLPNLRSRLTVNCSSA